MIDETIEANELWVGKKKGSPIYRFDDDDARVAPNARRVATLGQEENKAQRGHETR